MEGHSERIVVELCGGGLGEVREGLGIFFFFIIVNLEGQGKESRTRTFLEALPSQVSWNKV